MTLSRFVGVLQRTVEGRGVDSSDSWITEHLLSEKPDPGLCWTPPFSSGNGLVALVVGAIESVGDSLAISSSSSYQPSSSSYTLPSALRIPRILEAALEPVLDTGLELFLELGLLALDWRELGLESLLTIIAGGLVSGCMVSCLASVSSWSAS